MIPWFCAAALAGESDVDRALESWNAKETASALRLAALGEQMEQAFVWAAPDLGAMDEGQAQQWWSESITFPEDFTYVAS